MNVFNSRGCRGFPLVYGYLHAAFSSEGKTDTYQRKISMITGLFEPLYLFIL